MFLSRSFLLLPLILGLLGSPLVAAPAKTQKQKKEETPGEFVKKVLTALPNAEKNAKDKTFVESAFDWDTLTGESGDSSTKELFKKMLISVLSKEAKTFSISKVTTKGDKADIQLSRKDPSAKESQPGPTFKLKKKNGKWLIVEISSPAQTKKE